MTYTAQSFAVKSHVLTERYMDLKEKKKKNKKTKKTHENILLQFLLFLKTRENKI